MRWPSGVDSEGIAGLLQKMEPAAQAIDVALTGAEAVGGARPVVANAVGQPVHPRRVLGVPGRISAPRRGD